MEKFSIIKKVLNNYADHLDNKYIKRHSKITFRDVLYELSLKTINNTSYDNAVYMINSKNNTNISASTYKKKNNFLTADDIINLNKKLLDVIYSEHKPRIIAVDGTRLKCLKSLHSDGVKFASTNETYTQLLVSGLYDVNDNILINYNHSLTLNERECFIQQLDYVNSGDTLIFDRGYYSLELLNILKQRDINYIFRVKNTLTGVKELLLNDVNEFYTSHNTKVVTYSVIDDGEPYYLLTNLLYLNINELKDLYKDRWSIETHFNNAKYHTSLLNLCSRNIESLLRDIHMHNFIFILYSHFNNIVAPIYNNETHNLNDKLCIEIFARDILHVLLYKTKYIKPIKTIILILPKTYIHEKDRHYIRQSKRIVSSWYIRPQRIRDKRHNISITSILTDTTSINDIFDESIIFNKY